MTNEIRFVGTATFEHIYIFVINSTFKRNLTQLLSLLSKIGKCKIGSEKYLITNIKGFEGIV